MELPRDLAHMDAERLRDLTSALFAKLQQRENEISERDAELKYKQLKIDQLIHEMAVLKHWRYAKRSEQLDVVQRSLLEESIDADLEAIDLKPRALRKPSTTPKAQPRRVALPANLPRREIRHEPGQRHCSCGCALERIGESLTDRSFGTGTSGCSRTRSA